MQPQKKLHKRVGADHSELKLFKPTALPTVRTVPDIFNIIAFFLEIVHFFGSVPGSSSSIKKEGARLELVCTSLCSLSALLHEH